MILAGRRINDGVGRFVAQKAIKLLVSTGTEISSARVGLLGLTFKENVPDLRNSRVPDIISELKTFGVSPLIQDAICDPRSIEQMLGVRTDSAKNFKDLDVLILAVTHDDYVQHPAKLFEMLRLGGVFMDLKSAFEPATVREDLNYWSL